jgi:peptidoglycan/LPS O-acetylase OafA/YrhL
MTFTTDNIHIHARYRQLDSLRGLAAICVFFSHYFLIFKVNEAWASHLKASPLGILVNGNAAVLFFFVLSGFVLTLPFANNKKPLKLTEFYIKRLFRIYPAYIMAILFAIILKTFFYDKIGIEHFTPWVSHFWEWTWNKQSYLEILKTFTLLAPNFNVDLIDPVIWSLVVEIKISILLPFFIVLISRNNVLFNTGFFLITLVLVYNHTSIYLFVFYLGVLCARYKDILVAKVQTWSVPVVIVVLIFSLFLYNINFEFFKLPGDDTHPFGYFWRDLLSTIGSCAIIIIAVARKRIATLFEMRFFIFTGDISYSFYLLHLPILITVCSIFSTGTITSYIYIFLSVLVTSFILSYLNFKFVEITFQRYAKNLTAKWSLLKTGNL